MIAAGITMHMPTLQRISVLKWLIKQIIMTIQ